MVTVNDAGQQVTQGFPRSGLCNPHHVLARQSQREALGLDGSGGRVASLPDLGHHVVREVPVLEPLDGVGAGPANILHYGDLLLHPEGLDMPWVRLPALLCGVVQVLLEGFQRLPAPVDGPEASSGLLPLQASAATESISPSSEAISAASSEPSTA